MPREAIVREGEFTAEEFDESMQYSPCDCAICSPECKFYCSDAI